MLRQGCGSHPRNHSGRTPSGSCGSSRLIPALERIRCPTLALYGETDECILLIDSTAAWFTHGSNLDCEITLRRLPGADHLPTYGGLPDAAEITAKYSEAVSSWLDRHLADPHGLEAGIR
jgi:pimeloyl-ACP methyl ester carboxylesterase